MRNEVLENVAVLDKILPVVVRVHGGNHPELADIQSQYNVLREQLENEADTTEPISEIRRLTDNYTLPEDACEAYTKVYNALKDIDNIVCNY